MATFAIDDEREKLCQTGSYISSKESVWRIFGFDMHQRYQKVLNLAIHPENGRRGYFIEDINS